MRIQKQEQSVPACGPTAARLFDEPGSGGISGSGFGRIAELKFSMRTLRRHLGLIITSMVCINVVAAIVVWKLPPQYTAESSVLIGPRQAQVMDVKAVIAGLSSDTDVLESEIQILRSRLLARNVVLALKLDHNPAINPALASPSWHQRIVTELNVLIDMLPAVLQPARPAPLTDEERSRLIAAHDPIDRVIDNFLRHLVVAAKGRSRVVGISYTSADPVLSADIANGVASAYINEQLRAKTDATEHAHEWLEQRVTELHKQVITADTAVENYRQRSGLIEGKIGLLSQEQISDLSQQIVLAQAQRATAEARAKEVTAALTSQQGIYDLPEVQASSIIRDLRAQESALVTSTVAMSTNFNADFPKLRQAHAQLDAIHDRIRVEVERIAAGLRIEAGISAVREQFLENKLTALGNQMNLGKEGQIQMRSLQHESDADRTLYDKLLARAKETQVENGLQQPDAQMVSGAEPPEAPSFPNPLIMLPASFVASCLLTVLLVMLMEALDHGLSNLEEVEGELGVTALGAVPRLPRRVMADRRPPPEAMVLRHPESAYSEALRGLYTNLLLSGDGRPTKVLLFASAAPNEGKTTVVLSLARLLAASGKRVVVVDCDTRRPGIHTALHANRGPGLSDCLRDGIPASTVLQPDSSSPAMLLAAGTERAIAPGEFASDAMRALIQGLSERFELVLLDSAPVLVVSDTRALAQLADKTVLLVRWQATRREQAAAALRQMLMAGANVSGVLLSMVSPKSYASRGESGLLNRHVRMYLAR